MNLCKDKRRKILRVKVSFFIIIGLILSFYIIPSAFSEDTELERELENRPGPVDSQTGPAGTIPSEVKPAEAKPAPAVTEPAATEKPAPTETKPEEIKQPEAVPAIPVEPEKKPVTPPRAPQPRVASGTVSFFFDDADIFEVAQTVFGDVLKVNYIIDPRVKGRVNFRTVTPIPRAEVLPMMEIILRLNGIGFVEEQGLYNIVPLDEVSRELLYAQIGKTPENVAIELFTFKNMNLKDSMSEIENALGLSLKGGMVRIMPVYHMNSLIVVASTKEQLEYIRKWIEVFDNMFSAARPKIFVYPVQNSKAKDVASLLQSIFGGAAGPTSAPATRTEPTKTAPGAPSPSTPTGPKSGAAVVVSGTGTLISAETKIFADEITNSLIILATPTDYEFIKETILKIDIMPRQVVIEGLIARVDLTDNLSFGLSWSLNTDVKISGIKPFVNNINLNGNVGINPGGLVTTMPAKGFTFVGTDPKGVVRAVLTALAEESKAKVLAAPHILVSDNREARIQVGRQVPIATSTSTTPLTGGTEATNYSTSTIQYKDIGIILKVKPQINDSGLVSLEITQEISSLGETVKVGGLDEISINKTEATTNLVAQDGDTIIIGGLIQEDVSKSKDGIPFLSKIPIIGNLFGNTTDKNTRTELIILLTPHVMKNQQEAGDVTSDYVDRYKGSTKDKDINKFLKERSQKEKSGGNAETKDAK
jgi:type II secretion system protein D